MSDRLKILIVDDHSALRKAYHKFFEIFLPNADIVGECEDGNDVFTFLENNQVDVILMDVRMHNLNGYDTTKMVKIQFPGIKIIGMSNEFDQVTHDAMIAAGASYFFCKTVEPNILITAILN